MKPPYNLFGFEVPGIEVPCTLSCEHHNYVVYHIFPVGGMKGNGSVTVFKTLFCIILLFSFSFSVRELPPDACQTFCMLNHSTILAMSE